MAQKCFLWRKHVFEFMSLGGSFRCAVCRRRWDFGGREIVPDDGSGSWAVFESKRDKMHDGGLWDMHSSSATLRQDGYGNFTDDERALALAECVIKQKGWTEDKKEYKTNPVLAKYKKEHREEILSFAKANSAEFLRQIFGK